EKKTWLCYDADLLRVSMLWTGEFLEFGNTLTTIAWPPPPQVKGTPIFSTKPGPGWAAGESLEDPRPTKQGPLPKDWAHYTGLYQNGDKVVVACTVGKTEVLESPEYSVQEGTGVLVRHLEIGPSKQRMTMLVTGFDADPDDAEKVKADANANWVVVGKTQRIAAGFTGAPNDTKFTKGANDLRLEIPPHSKSLQINVLVAAVPDDAALAHFKGALSSPAKALKLRSLCKGGPAHWIETVTTKGTRSESKDAYVVDTLTEPVNNPYNAKTFFSGFDFFSDGRAAICTFHGDVWLVSGIDDTLQKLTWKRFATGMFQPLGLKIVKDTVYVLGRDQITRLHDLNNDGEADYYENFNNDTIVTANYHEFSLDLHTDRAGNFYFAKGSPWEPEVTSPHQGCLFKVSKDGSKMEIIATGFRAPNGMTVGPRDEITVSDNQGHWMPSSKMDWIEKGGFYGMTPAAHRKLELTWHGTNFTANPSEPAERAAYKFKAWGDDRVPTPINYDKPMNWLPMNMDNSSGGQVWATDKKWGPLAGHLLFMSYGKCTLFEVMPEVVDGVHQGAMIQLPFRFSSGVMRGRVNPKDGQVYVCGLKGWQSSAARDGGFYRVRFTGEPVRMPVEYQSSKLGVQLKFTCALDQKSATDPANYNVERWNYHWTGSYGSPEFSVTEPEQKRHDKLEVQSVSLLPDGKTVVLKIADMRPADQIKIKYSVADVGGTQISQEVYATAYKLKPEFWKK
ncbi:MAG TPA: DUF6797 domain-containing protein, partial [Candidatus Saccharimonadales bacterium]|nr:DUF6797 domain-containing protein [Candidatus Saccharimonadales bacterium]